jgi:hypothetical protein
VYELPVLKDELFLKTENLSEDENYVNPNRAVPNSKQATYRMAAILIKEERKF